VSGCAPAERGGYSIAQLSFFAGARGFGAAVATREFLDPTGRIDELLFAREKRMTSGADADFNIMARRAGMINRAARADDVSLMIFRMNACFHVSKMSAKPSRLAENRKA
jgi:hypothetical protein